MARKDPRIVSGSVANAAVRCFLMDASELGGGPYTNKHFAEAIEFFGGRCAYSGEELGKAVKDHAIPINKSACGLHLPGNVVPATKKANSSKGDSHYQDYLAKDPERRKRIDEFLGRNGYYEAVQRIEAKLGKLQPHCERVHAMADDLCRRHADYLSGALGVDPEERMTLPIYYYTPDTRECDETTFKAEFLRRGKAWAVVLYQSGDIKVKPWEGGKLNEKSSISTNLRNWTDFKTGEWQARGIEHVRMVLEEPNLDWDRRNRGPAKKAAEAIDEGESEPAEEGSPQPAAPQPAG